MQWWCSANGQAWRWAWTAYPGVWLVVLALAIGYYALTRAPQGHSRAGIAAGWLGVLTIWIALDWPVGPLAAGYLASVHALQFMLIAMVAAPLLLVGVRAVADRLPRQGASRALLELLTQPLIAAIFFNVVTITTHVSGVVDTLMTSQLGAFAIDIGWLLSALCFWWPVIVPVPERPRFNALFQILYLFIGTMFHTVIAIIMLMADFPLYRVYELAPPMSHLSSMDDLQIAGGIMELLGLLIVFSIITVRFFHWANRIEREEHARPGREPAPPTRPAGANGAESR